MNLKFCIVIEQFREYLRARGFSERTVRDYPVELSKFLEFVESEACFVVNEITRKHIEGFHHMLLAREFKGKPLSQSTLSKAIVMLKCFFKFLYKTEQIYIDPSQHYDTPKRPKLLPRNILEVWEVDLLISQPDITTLVGSRDRAILELLYSTGLRNSELRALRLDKVYLRERQIQVMGKGSKEALIPFGTKCLEALEHYFLFSRSKLLLRMNQGGPKYKGEDATSLVFLSKNGNKIDISNLGLRLKKYGMMAGLQKEVTPHGLRHSCATHLLKNGADIRLIQKLLRHEDLNTTQIYTKVDTSDLKEAQMRYHPRERLARGG